MVSCDCPDDHLNDRLFLLLNGCCVKVQFLLVQNYDFSDQTEAVQDFLKDCLLTEHEQLVSSRLARNLQRLGLYL